MSNIDDRIISLLKSIENSLTSLTEDEKTDLHDYISSYNTPPSEELQKYLFMGYYVHQLYDELTENQLKAA